MKRGTRAAVLMGGWPSVLMGGWAAVLVLCTGGLPCSALADTDPTLPQASTPEHALSLGADSPPAVSEPTPSSPQTPSAPNAAEAVSTESVHTPGAPAAASTKPTPSSPQTPSAPNAAEAVSTESVYTPGAPLPAVVYAQFSALRDAYPAAQLRLEAAEDGVYVWHGQTRILHHPVGLCPPVLPYAPEDPPLCATFAAVYHVGKAGKTPPPGYDPGRVRSEALLKSLYGQTAKEVKAQSRQIAFCGSVVPFHAAQGVGEALERVAARLQPLAAQDPTVRAYLFPLGGTFKWRVIKGSQRLSMHSFAVAIDLNTQKGLYWQWSRHLPPAAITAARHGYPQSIIDAFEAEGFIWGGKWDAFDLMHFEYRPEIVRYAAALRSSAAAEVLQ